MKQRWHWIISGLVVVVGIAGIFTYSTVTNPRNQTFLQWWQGSAIDRSQLVTIQRTACENAPFILPADGYIGLLYGDPRGPYSTRRRHQGIDIFSQTKPGETPVYAAYDGYLTRESTWKSTVIQRVPNDPLNPGRQIWLYYTHMATADGLTDFIEPTFVPGTREVFVEQGTLLGYTGNYSGNPANPTGTHLHFSIIQDVGNTYANELDFKNSIDSSPYLGMAVNYACQLGPPSCTPNPLCADAITP
jgi:murein DD-endopeptidase MepM/ murein hydrolase activator NlpD